VSDVPFDPTAGAAQGQQQPSEEEVRAYLAELREAPVDQVLAEVVNALLNAAQVKVGRRDGRLLIDTVSAVTEQARGHVPDELTSQLDQAINQLRLAQVEGEEQVRQAAASGETESGDLATDPAAEGSPEPVAGEEGGTPSPPKQPPAGGDAASRLWVPGR
jgi:hypothetical protein